MKKNNEKFVAHGYMGMNNFGGIEIQINDFGDSARLRFCDGEITDWLEIEYGINEDDDGDIYTYNYVRFNNEEYRLDEFERIDIQRGN